MEWIKRIYLQCIPLRFGVCLSFYLVFRLYCVTTVTPFIRRSQGWSLRSGRVLTSRNKNAVFFAEIQICCNLFQLHPKRETSSSSLGDRLERRSIITPSNRAICDGLRGTSGYLPLLVTSVACTNQFASVDIGNLARATICTYTDTKTQWNTL